MKKDALSVTMLIAVLASLLAINTALSSPSTVIGTQPRWTTPVTERGLGYSVYFFMEGLLASVTPTLAAGVIQLTDVWFILPISVIFLIASVIVLQFLAYPKRH